MKRECETCIKRKTTYCPTSMECMATDDMPYYQNRIMLLEENKQLKDNWIKLKEYIGSEWYCFDNESVEFEVAKSILNRMQELEQGSDNIE